MALKILVVEDAFQVRTLIMKIVRHMYPDAVVEGAPGGREALRYAVRNIPNLIITDLEMPSYSGSDLMLSLKDCQETAAIPCIVVTSHADRAFDSRVTRDLESLGLPGVPVVAKPLDIGQFTACVRQKIEEQLAVH